MMDRLSWGALVAALAVLLASTAAAARTPSRPAAPRRPALTVQDVAGPPSAIAEQATLVAYAAVLNRTARAARGPIGFYASARPRWSRRAVHLGTVTLRVRARGNGVATLRTRLPSAVRAGRWSLLACTRTGADAICTVWQRSLDVSAPTS